MVYILTHRPLLATYATPRMQSHVCNPTYATPRMQPHVCNPTYATPRMQPHVCNPTYATPRMQPHVDRMTLQKLVPVTKSYIVTYSAQRDICKGLNIHRKCRVSHPLPYTISIHRWILSLPYTISIHRWILTSPFSMHMLFTPYPTLLACTGCSPLTLHYQHAQVDYNLTLQHAHVVHPSPYTISIHRWILTSPYTISMHMLSTPYPTLLACTGGF